MVPPDLPADVVDFLDKYIDSIPELETLLMMGDDPRQPWTEAVVARRIYVPVGVARSILETLLRRRLIVAAEDGCRFAASDDAQRALVMRVANTYRSNLVSVANFIHKKAPASVMEFARAFDLKKKDH
jgi:hypothetical protein